MMKKRIAYLLVAIAAVFAVTAGVMYLMANETSAPGSNNDQQNDTTQTDDETQTQVDKDTEPSDNSAATGRYVDYSADEVAASGYDRTLLFFHAPWCPECRAYEQAIENGSLPAGTQILKVDYDSSTDLRKQYGVTIQTTFVRVDDDGNKQLLWSGYGKDKSVQTILDNTTL